MATSTAKPPFGKHVTPIINGNFQSRSQPTTPRLAKPPVLPFYDSITPTLYLKQTSLIPIHTAKEYLQQSFDLERLHRVQKWLWLAGLPLPARSLHRQKILGREIVITEQADMHLTWRESTLFLKPLWKPLLDYAFWEEALCHGDPAVYQSAAGLVLSYTWLIASKPDLQIAKQHKLVPKKLKWEVWAAFVRDFLKTHNLHNFDSLVAARYDYGDLRLNRLNLIYRFAPELFPTYLMRGYFYGYNRYSQFFGRNFAWAAVAVLYVGVVLAAMQVAGTVNPLKDDETFQRAAFGFSVFTMVAMVFFSGVALGYFVVMFTLNLIFTKARVKEKARLKQCQSTAPTSDARECREGENLV
ncbi:hypothetical protein CDD81_1463 [Ophiocordyceps australis]|uniref:Uncharacterized protein n=1 Tax=Ophiocordyceps australis TaxID=1399860 RepID=A0A2C5YDF8_9HYPO|nr:hypothetical protein CDD81_1463 [Ophiocordyceps australis]